MNINKRPLNGGLENDTKIDPYIWPFGLKSELLQRGFLTEADVRELEETGWIEHD